MQRRFARRRSAIHGYGVFALRPLRAGERLLEYRGRRLDQAEVTARFGQSAASGHTFLFSLNALYHIDGSDGGNMARWINHSCAPNCEAMIYVDINGDERRDRVYIQALRDITIGEELCFDYAIELSVVPRAATRAAWRCCCGAPSCRGSMLAT